MIEHIPYRMVPAIIEEWYRVLHPGGQLVIECPDFDRTVKEYLEGNTGRLANIFGHHRFAGDSHCWGYNDARLRDLLAACGFVEIKSLNPTDYHKEMEPCLRIEAMKPQVCASH